MAIVVRMPAALAQVTEGAIQKWLVEPGAAVAVGDLLAEVETEKAVVEFASEAAGRVGRLLVEEGRLVDVGTPVLVLLDAGETDADVDAALAAIGTGMTAEPPEAAPTAGAPAESAPSQPGPETSPQRSASGDSGVRLFASPIARRLAKASGIDLAGVKGTGPGGRIVRGDLEVLGEGSNGPPVPSPAIPAVPARVAPGAPAAYEDVPLTGMRRAIARRLTESKSTVPHFYLTAHVHADALLALRAEANEGAEMRLSVNDFVLKAVALALRRVPAANAIWNGDSVRQFTGVDIGVAIAVDGGLMTPVVRGVDRLSLTEIQRVVANFAERARAGRIRLEELEGGSFAVSNLGMYGVDEFSAILNPPQSGILAVSAAKPRPVVDEDGRLAVATVMTVTLSADHRVVDGAIAAQWMAAFVDLIERPVRMLV